MLNCLVFYGYHDCMHAMSDMEPIADRSEGETFELKITLKRIQMPPSDEQHLSKYFNLRIHLNPKLRNTCHSQGPLQTRLPTFSTMSSNCSYYSKCSSLTSQGASQYRPSSRKVSPWIRIS